jgi:hypothetical protein
MGLVESDSAEDGCILHYNIFNPIEFATFIRFYNNEIWSFVEIVTHNTYGGINNLIPTHNGDCWL